MFTFKYPKGPNIPLRVKLLDNSHLNATKVFTGNRMNSSKKFSIASCYYQVYMGDNGSCEFICEKVLAKFRPIKLNANSRRH